MRAIIRVILLALFHENTTANLALLSHSTTHVYMIIVYGCTVSAQVQAAAA